LGRWYFTNNEYSNLVACQWILAGTFQEHFMKLVLPMSFETDWEVVC
jgi:hypothetical protein